MIKSIEGFYLNVSSYSPLIGSTYVKFPSKLKHRLKGLSNIQNNDNKCFLWCHVRHLNLVDKNPQKITKKDKELVSKLNYERVNFPVSKKDYCKIEAQNKLDKGFINFKNYFKQMPVLFKVYAGIECILKKVDCDVACSSNSSYTKNIKNIFLVVLLIR